MAASDAPPTRISLRDITHADVPAVRTIESVAYEDAWPARAFEGELENAFARYRVAVQTPEPPTSTLEAARDRLPEPLPRALGGPSRRGIVGFMGVWYMKDQMHLVTIAVAPEWQGRGVGQRLLLDCFDMALEAEFAMIVLEVRVSNARARALYEHFGFRRTGTLKAYYEDNHEDAHVMICDLTEDARAHLEARRAEHHARFGALFADVDPPAM